MFYEDLVFAPKAVAKQVTELLQVESEQRILNPCDSDSNRMVDGLYPQSRMAGDFKFGKFDRIVTDRVDAWRSEADPVALNVETVRLAERYGYEK